MEDLREVGGYRLVRRIGYGGMSSVYEAVDDGGAHYALKLLHPAIAADADARARLKREVLTLRRVESDYVAQVVDAELDDEHEIFLVTELVNGPTLEHDVRETGRYTEENLLRLGEHLERAVQALHEAGVLHRDLKPSNVMMDGERPVLIDFGIAQQITDSRLTQQGFLAHTPGYCDPRVLRGGEPDEDADWWALVAVLAYAATGVAPFGVGSPAVVLERVLNGRPDLPNLDPVLQAAFSEALSVDAARRLSFSELLDVIADPQSAAAAVVVPAVEATQIAPGPEEIDLGVPTLLAPPLTVPTVVTPEPLAPTRVAPAPSQDAQLWAPPEELSMISDAEMESAPTYVPRAGLVQAQVVQPDALQAATTPQFVPPPHVQPQLDPQMAGVDPQLATALEPGAFVVPPLRRYGALTFMSLLCVALGAASFPVLAAIFLVVTSAVFDFAGETRAKLYSRRIRRGRAAGSDVAVSILQSPFIVVLALIRTALTLGVALGAAWAVAKYIALPNFFSGQPWGTALAIFCGFLLAVFIIWISPLSAKLRTGTRLMWRGIAPTGSYEVLWFFILFALAALAVWFASAAAPSWIPLKDSLLS